MVGFSVPMPKQFQMGQMGAVIYERPGKNLIETDALREIWKVEVKMHTTPG
jgi:hypothetical protein